MSPLAYLGTLVVMVGLAAVCDALWMRVIRPRLTRTRGPITSDEHIPALAWVGVLVLVSVAGAVFSVGAAVF